MRVLILGGGYSGIFAASNLCKNKNVQVTLVSDGPQLQLLQNIHRVASGKLQPRDIMLDIQGILGKDVIFVKGKSEKVDLVAKQAEIILIESGMVQIIQYDCLIIAIGAKNAYFGIKGARENTLSLRSVDDSIKLDRIIKTLPQGSILTIAGGGATGLSLTGALSEKYGNKIKIRVIEAQKEVLPGWDPLIIEMVKGKLEKNKNLEILRGKPIIEIGLHSITLSSGETLQTNVTVWTAGIGGQDLNIIPEVKRSDSGRIIVNKYSQVLWSDGGVLDNVFAIGDISAFPLDNEGKMSPQLAQFAVRQARNVAKNILRKESGEEMIELEYLQKGQIISLGTNCMGTLNGFPISGWLCENTEDFVIDNYIKAVLNRGEGLEGLVYDGNSIGTEIVTSVNFISYLCKRLMIPSSL
ncbi:MAG TPA: FAD-dependent oxidoreductase [Nitrososphaeraceae archaeon]|nr:FAD-dependent oxidoreductase [Nitrososphaeraceae archaeon]